MQIVKPVFVVGSGRSGTTLLHDILAINDDVCWISDTTNKYYKVPQLAFLERVLDVPFVGKILKRKVITESSWHFIRPSEGENIYQNYCGYGVGKILTSADSSPNKNKKMKDMFLKHLLFSGKSRFINKSPSNVQRVDLLNAIFPDAYFIHIIRDGRAVVGSLSNVPWWKDIKLWWANGKLPLDLELRGVDPVIVKAKHWEHNIKEVRRHKKRLKGRYMEVFYEDLIADVPETIKRICTFCSLNCSKEYLSLIPASFPSTNYKWKKTFTPIHKKLLNGILRKTLDSMGYK